MSDDIKPDQEQGPESSGADSVAELENLQIENDDFQPGPGDVAGPDEKKEVPTAEVLELAIGPLFAIFAPAWGVSGEEVKALSGAYADLIDKYFPDFEAGPEVTAIMVTGMVVMPRIGQPRTLDTEGGEHGDKSEHGPHE